MAKGPTTSKRLLFHRPDGTPYDFWVQSDFETLTKDTLTRQIEKHGGRVTEFAEFPEHGFILLDALDPCPLYEVKTPFHKPVKCPGFPYDASKSIKPTPLRHVLSYHFVAAVIEKGHWDRYDLLRWGFAARLTADDLLDPNKAVRGYQDEVRLGVDPEMEHAWIWATGRVFDSYDPAYRFTKEFKIIDDRVASESTPKENPTHWRKWLRGRIVADCRLKLHVKFYLHDDISKEEQNKLVITILENGGSTCYEAQEADVILVGCEADELEEDVDIVDWMRENPRPLTEGRQRTLIKFTSWVATCIQAGNWRLVPKKAADVADAYRKLRGEKRPTLDKGKGKASISTEFKSSGVKRKRPSNENLVHAEEGSSPLKRRKQQPEKTPKNPPRPLNGLGSKSNGTLLGNQSESVLEPQSASTVRPTRIFKGVNVPIPQPSPLKHDANTTSLMLAPASTSRLNHRLIDVEDHQRRSDAARPTENVTDDDHSLVVDPHQHSRVSAASVMTVDTASSKLGNTTTNTTATTGTSQSARSVGPSIPTNAKQVARQSASTGVGTEASGASRGALDQSVDRSPRKSAQSTWSAPGLGSEFEADDNAGEIILNSFTSEQPKDLPEQAEQRAPLQLNEFEESLVACWRRMSEIDYREGIETFQGWVDEWPEMQRKIISSRERKGKGRVSFHEPARELGTDEGVLETDYDDATVEAPPAAAKRSFNRQAYARIRGNSKTPDSVVSSDEEASQPPDSSTNKRVANVGSASRAKPKTSARKEPTIRKDSPRVEPSSKRSRRGAFQQPKALQGALTDTTVRGDKHDQGEVSDPEENDQLAPLPKAAKGRPQRKRGTSVVSEDESVAGDFRPRRGRSASAAPPEPVSERAPNLPNAEPGRKLKFARKTAGGKAPKR